MHWWKLGIVCAGILPTPLDLAVRTQGLNLFPCIFCVSNHIHGLPKIHISQNVKEFWKNIVNWLSERQNGKNGQITRPKLKRRVICPPSQIFKFDIRYENRIATVSYYEIRKFQNQLYQKINGVGKIPAIAGNLPILIFCPI